MRNKITDDKEFRKSFANYLRNMMKGIGFETEDDKIRPDSLLGYYLPHIKAELLATI